MAEMGFNWHELMSRDPDASQRFYEEVTGVSFVSVDAAGDYRLILVGGRPVAGMTGPRSAQGEWPSGGPQGHWVAYFDSDDVDTATRRTQELGGEVLVEPVDIPGSGRAAVLRDPDGATFGVFRAALPPTASTP